MTTSRLRALRDARIISREHIELIVLLRALKDRSQLTFDELAARTAVLTNTTTVSASTLKRATDSRAVPQEHVVTTYIRACGAGIDQEREALRLWRAARIQDRGILATLRAPAVRSIRTPEDLDAALAAAYERAGAPTLRALQERATTDQADGALLLPLTSAWRIIRREGRPTTWEQCEAFLRACGINHRRMSPWQDAWQRARSFLPGEHPAPGRSRSQWTGRTYPSTPLGPAGTDPHTSSSPRHTLKQKPAFPARAIATLLNGITPADQNTILTTARNQVKDTRARRNGTAPDTGIDAIAVSADGTLHVFQAKQYTGPTPRPYSADPTPPPLTGPERLPERFLSRR